MIKNIKIGKIKAIKNPKNKFVLHLKTEHGDADHDEIQTFTWDREVAIKYWNLLSVYFDNGFNGMWVGGVEIEEKIKSVVEDRGRGIGLVDPWEAYSELVGYDITYTDVRARPTCLWLTYFDENGIEYEVDEPKQLGW